MIRGGSLGKVEHPSAKGRNRLADADSIGDIIKSKSQWCWKLHLSRWLCVLSESDICSLDFAGFCLFVPSIWSQYEAFILIRRFHRIFMSIRLIFIPSGCLRYVSNIAWCIGKKKVKEAFHRNHNDVVVWFLWGYFSSIYLLCNIIMDCPVMPTQICYFFWGLMLVN